MYTPLNYKFIINASIVFGKKNWQKEGFLGQI